MELQEQIGTELDAAAFSRGHQHAAFEKRQHESS